MMKVRELRESRPCAVFYSEGSSSIVDDVGVGGGKMKQMF